MKPSTSSKKMPKQRVVAAYIPVLHQGYLEFFKKIGPVDTLYLFGTQLLKTEDYLRKDLRAIDPETMSAALVVNNIAQKIVVATPDLLTKLAGDVDLTWLMPDEDVSHSVQQTYLPDATVEFMPVFLRWDRGNVQGVDQDVEDANVTQDEFATQTMASALREAKQSPDIWRHVGAALVDSKGKLLGVASNQPALDQQTPMAEGDPRNIFKRGVGIEMSTFFHAEAALIAEAAKSGTSLEGASIYATTFPCPPCAMLIANSGIKTCYFVDGYAVLDGKRVLQKHGVELIRIIADTGGNEATLPYPEKG